MYFTENNQDRELKIEDLSTEDKTPTPESIDQLEKHDKTDTVGGIPEKSEILISNENSQEKLSDDSKDKDKTESLSEKIENLTLDLEEKVKSLTENLAEKDETACESENIDDKSSCKKAEESKENTENLKENVEIAAETTEEIVEGDCGDEKLEKAELETKPSCENSEVEPSSESKEVEPSCENAEVEPSSENVETESSCEKSGENELKVVITPTASSNDEKTEKISQKSSSESNR